MMRWGHREGCAQNDEVGTHLGTWEGREPCSQTSVGCTPPGAGFAQTATSAWCEICWSLRAHGEHTGNRLRCLHTYYMWHILYVVLQCWKETWPTSTAWELGVWFPMSPETNTWGRPWHWHRVWLVCSCVAIARFSYWLRTCIMVAMCRSRACWGEHNGLRCCAFVCRKSGRCTCQQRTRSSSSTTAGGPPHTCVHMCAWFLRPTISGGRVRRYAAWQVVCKSKKVHDLVALPEGARMHTLPEGARMHTLPEGARMHTLPDGARMHTLVARRSTHAYACSQKEHACIP